MQTLVKLEGVPKELLEVLVKRGYFKTRTEAIRAGILSLGKEYSLIKSPKDLENELVALKLKEEEEEMRKKGEKYIGEKEALAKYR
ncbi:MAG TPA: hypothetical protein VJH23_06195 [archaeon]|nr:hypothetical protein [archaeon]